MSPSWPQHFKSSIANLEWDNLFLRKTSYRRALYKTDSYRTTSYGISSYRRTSYRADFLKNPPVGMSSVT